MGKSIIETIERFPMTTAGGGLEFAISLYRPEGDHAPGSLPLAFITDADFKMGMAAEMLGLQCMSRLLAPAILVGIGYGRGIAEAAETRWRDLTPPTSEEALRDLPLLAAMVGPETGGAEAFLSFLLDELAPEVVRRYPAAAGDRRFLFGSSLGGLFSLYALLSRPDAFETVVAGSPALFWNRDAVMDMATTFAGKLARCANKPRVLIGVGGREDELPDAAPAGSPFTLSQWRDAVAAYATIGKARILADRLRAAGLADVEFVLFEGENHQQVPPAILNRGLRFALGRT